MERGQGGAHRIAQPPDVEPAPDRRAKADDRPRQRLAIDHALRTEGRRQQRRGRPAQQPVLDPVHQGGPARAPEIVEGRVGHEKRPDEDKAADPHQGKGAQHLGAAPLQTEERDHLRRRDQQQPPGHQGIDAAENQSIAVGAAHPAHPPRAVVLAKDPADGPRQGEDTAKGHHRQPPDDRPGGHRVISELRHHDGQKVVARGGGHLGRHRRHRHGGERPRDIAQRAQAGPVQQAQLEDREVKRQPQQAEPEQDQADRRPVQPPPQVEDQDRVQHQQHHARE